MRTSGTLLSVELSLGYDVSRRVIEKQLLDAATATGLESPFVQIRHLGDFSVTYQVSGLLTEVNKLIDKRRELRSRTMDTLHEAGIEIVSPTFMNTRSFDPDEAFIPDETPGEEEAPAPATSTDALVFDKAEEAESVTRLREMLAETRERIEACESVAKDAGNQTAADAARQELESLNNKAERLTALIDKREAEISKE
jgi:hypothetical protein